VVGLKDNATLTVTNDVAEWSVAPSATLETFNFFNPNSPLNITSDSKDVKYINEETEGDGLLVIPQSLEGVQLLVTYTMTVDPNNQEDNDEVITETTKTVTLKTNSLLKLEQNKVYTLNLSISADEILYSPAVNEWDETGSGEYTVPEVQ
jgi:hypothetical protein